MGICTTAPLCLTLLWLLVMLLLPWDWCKMSGRASSDSMNIINPRDCLKQSWYALLLIDVALGSCVQYCMAYWIIVKGEREGRRYGDTCDDDRYMFMLVYLICYDSLLKYARINNLHTIGLCTTTYRNHLSLILWYVHLLALEMHILCLSICLYTNCLMHSIIMRSFVLVYSLLLWWSWGMVVVEMRNIFLMPCSCQNLHLLLFT